MVADETARVVAAAAVVVLYLALCGATFFSQRRKRGSRAGDLAALASAGDDTRPLLIAFASQTGTAQGLAWQTARSLRASGLASRVVAMSELVADDLRQAQSALFLVSTYGEGDPPDNGALFARRLMSDPLPLPELSYGLLALGDRAYANFRGFGLALERWLDSQGAKALFERVDVDNADEAALRVWNERLGGMGASDLPLGQMAPVFEEWQLVSRCLLNPGSAGGPTFHVELAVPTSSRATAWQAGDLLQVLAPGDPTRPRDYSISSLPVDGTVHLLVRQERRADGTVGAASGLLTRDAEPGSLVQARLRPHPHFHLGDNAARPLILIGNGTGLAGLRVLMKAREASGVRRTWLVYGERNRETDYYYREEIERWRASGVLERVDLVFSRDQPERRYVQHRLTEAAGPIREWIRKGAAVYVCGSLQGMAAGVDEALESILTRAELDELMAQGRYRRDVY